MEQGPQQIGIYLIERLLGRGGMGSVYLATDPTLKRPVALKVLAPELAADPEYVARFVREATSLAQIRHPNLVHIYAVGQDASRHYIAMEYLKGHSVAELLRQRGPLPWPAALRFLGQVLSALDKVHAAGIVHRDLKPANILIDEDQRAILMDFGLAKPRHDRSVTTGHALIGTPEYMAPELAEGQEADFRSDLYALGVVLFEMLTGQVPFQGKSAIATLRQHLEKEAPSVRSLTPTVPPALDEVLARALAKSPADRYPGVRALAADLCALVRTPELAALAAAREGQDSAPTVSMDAGAPEPGTAPTAPVEPLTAPTVAAAPSRRRWFLAGVAACVLALALGGLVIPRFARRLDGDRASRTVYVVHSRTLGAVSGRLIAIEGERGRLRLKTSSGVVEIPYADVLKIEPVAGR